MAARKKPDALQAAARRSPAARQMRDAAEGWQPLSGSARDLPGVTHQRMQEIAAYLWHRNPLGKRVIDAQAEWMIGEGATFSVEDPRADALLRAHWDVNRWDMKLPQLVKELGLFGEEFAPAFQNPYSGVIKFGVLDPTWVEQVVTSPDDATMPIGVVQKAHTAGGRERRWRVLLRKEDEAWLSPAALAERERFTDGELVVTAVNKLRTATRGVSDLFALADWLDGYEQLLFADLVRTKATNHYLWDYEFTGWSQQQIDDYLAEMPPPRPLSIFGHNEKVKRTLVGGAEKSAAASESIRSFRNHVLGGAGQPEHWYGGGGDVNRSTADSMDGHTVKTLTARQTSLRWLIEDRLRAQIDAGIRVGYLRDTPEARAVTVTLPDLSTKDVSRVASALQSIAGAVTIAQQGGFADEETGARFMAALGTHVGLEIDPEEMLARAREQRGRNAADDLGRLYDERLAGRGPAGA
ncbi:hypothetical protein [Longimicrobium sp.]|uniref:hypothetical protein n=1 Tax=Longimicrobium sp. TaxID=2029185 RepID=UPI002E35C037|nr:hypothetical protein [Longimicrobium sp.]HEX6039133.1 hypothetical protein [Longimicrobium sp.]